MTKKRKDDFLRSRKCVQIMRIMKFYVLLMAFGMLHAYGNVHSQNLTLNMENVSLKEVFKEIEAKSDYHFLFRSDDVVEIKGLTLSVNMADIDEVLALCFKGTRLIYEKDGFLIIVKKGTRINAPEDKKKQKVITIKGIVKDDEGIALPGVSVIIKGTQTGVATDIDGKFEIKIEERPGLVLQFSFVGMKNQEVKYENQQLLEIVLKSDTETLDEVVCTGFQTISRERATGSFQVINANELKTIPAQDLGAKLEGLTSGMQVEYNEQTGTTDITIRGIATMNADAKPLIVVDGFPVEGDFSTINPNDIESVTVLKDAAAASIWGARAGNGVVVVTTKSGNKSDKPRVSFDAFVRVSPKIDLGYNLPTASSAAQLELEKFEQENGYGLIWGTPGSFDYVTLAYTQGAQLIYDHMNGVISDSDYQIAYERLKNTDNKKQIKKYMLNTPFSQNYNLAVNGGGKVHYYNLSAMYSSDENSLKGNKREKLLINFKNTFELANWMNFDFALTSEMRKDRTGLSFEDMTQLSPYELLKNEDGSYAPVVKKYNKQLMDEFLSNAQGMPYGNMDYNPLQDLDANKFITKQMNLRFQAGLNVKFFDGLEYRGSFQYERFKTNEDKHYGEESFYVRELANSNVDYNEGSNTVEKMYMPEGDILESTETLAQNYNLRNQISFNRIFAEKHSISVIVGSELIWTEKTGSGNVLYGYNSSKNTHITPSYGYGSGDVVWANLFNPYSLGSLPDGHELTYLADRFLSFYGNATYMYNDKYSISGSVRNDASNVIVDDPKYRYSPFWSIGGGWTLSREEFLQNVSWLDRLAVRITYGKNGNMVSTASSIPIISWNASPSPITGELFGKITDKGNPSLRWEKIEQMNIGIDFSLWNKLSGSIDYYNKQSKDLLAKVAITPTLGSSSQNLNAAEVRNNGIELDMNFSQRIVEDLKWNTGVKYSYNKSKVTHFQQQLMTTAAMMGYQFVEGFAVDPVFSYIYEGMNDDNQPIIRAAGTGNVYTMYDYTGGKPGLDMLKYEGTFTPTSIMSWSNTFTWRGFTLRAMITGKFGHKFRRQSFSYTDDCSSKNYHKDLKQILAGNAGRLGVPEIPTEYSFDYFNFIDYVPYLSTLVENASHIRLREIYLGYDLPKHICDVLHVRGVRVYSQVRNLGLIWAANKEGIDPDYISGSVLRPEVSFTFGLNVNF